MVSDSPTDGRCNAPAGPEKNGYCEQHPKPDENGDPINGRCHYHGAKSGAPAGNANHLTHGLRSRRPAHELYPQLPDDGKDMVDDLVAAYVERWGWDPDDPRIGSRLLSACVNVWRRWRAKGILIEEGPSEERKVGVNKLGDPILRTDEHHLRKSVSAINTDIRQELNDIAPDDGPDAAVNIAGEGMTVNFNVEEVSDNEEFIDADGEVVE